MFEGETKTSWARRSRQSETLAPPSMRCLEVAQPPWQSCLQVDCWISAMVTKKTLLNCACCATTLDCPWCLNSRSQLRLPLMFYNPPEKMQLRLGGIRRAACSNRSHSLGQLTNANRNTRVRHFNGMYCFHYAGKHIHKSEESFFLPKSSR